MLTSNQIYGIVLVVIALGLIAIYVMRYLAQRRKRILEDHENPSWSDDIAHNQLATTRVLIDRAEKNGVDVRSARSRLEEAEAREKAGSYREAVNLAKSARDMINTGGSNPVTRSRIPVRKSGTLEEDSLRFRDLSKMPGDKPEPESLPEPTPVAGVGGDPETATDVTPMQGFRKSVGRNYLESRFEMQMLGSDLQGSQGRQAEEATKLLAAAEKAYDREDYTESLRLALRGRRVLGPAGLQTVPLSPATVTEVPPQEPIAASRRSSAPPITPEVTVETGTGEVAPSAVICSRCGKDNPSKNRFCRGCGLPMKEAKCPRCQIRVTQDDTFCGSCGAPLAAMG